MNMAGPRRAGTDFSRIEASVTRITTVSQSAVALLQQLAAEFRANAGNAQKVTELADSLDAQAQTLADAVTANTPSSETPGGGETPGGEEPGGGGEVPPPTV
jgi:hypothetical protein